MAEAVSEEGIVSLPLRLAALLAVSQHPRTVSELRRELGYPAESTLRKHLKAYCEAGVLRGRRHELSPCAHQYTLRRSPKKILGALHLQARDRGREMSAADLAAFEAAVLLAISEIEMSVEISGECRLEAEYSSHGEQRLYELTMTVERGKLRSVGRRSSGPPTSRLSGPLCAWLEVIATGSVDRLDLEQAGPLGLALLKGMMEATAPPSPKPSSPCRAAARG